jgi:hypothetical protein
MRMPKIRSKQNKALVMEAFRTLFNKRDYAAAERSGRRNTSSVAPISPLVVRVCSMLSRAFHQA